MTENDTRNTTQVNIIPLWTQMSRSIKKKELTLAVNYFNKRRLTFTEWPLQSLDIAEYLFVDLNYAMHARGPGNISDKQY